MLSDDFDRTLPATRRRREQSRQDGYIVQSRVLTTGVLLILLGVTWNLLGGELMQSVVVCFRQSLDEWEVSMSDGASPSLDLRPILQAASMWGAVLLLGAVFAVTLQTHGWFVPRFALPHGTRVSPLQNIRRIFNSMGTRAFGAACSVGVSLVIVWSAWLQVQSGANHGVTGSTRTVAFAWASALERTTFQIGAGCVAYGLFDLFLRHRRRESVLQMTPAEWGEEQRSATRGPS